MIAFKKLIVRSRITRTETILVLSDVSCCVVLILLPRLRFPDHNFQKRPSTLWGFLSRYLFLDFVDDNQHDEVATEVQKLMEKSTSNGLQFGLVPRLKTILETDINRLWTSFSSVPLVSFTTLKIDLFTDAKLVRCRLQNYSQDQRKWLMRFVSSAVQHGMCYANRTPKRASVPLLFPIREANFFLTIDLRPVNKSTTTHHFPMRNIWNELTKLHRSTVYASVDLSHGYW